MGDLKTVLRFGWKYMRPYWTRLMIGIVFGCLCGATMTVSLLAVSTLIKRLQPPEDQTKVGQLDAVKAQASMIPISVSDSWKAKGTQFRENFEQAIDPWLPRRGRNLDWQQVVGGLLILPLIMLLRGSTDYISNYCMGWVSERVINDLRYDVLAKLTSLSLDYFNRSTTGDMLTRINADTSNLHRALRQGCADLIKEIVTIIGVGTMLIFQIIKMAQQTKMAQPNGGGMHWGLIILIVLFIPAVVFPLFVLGKKARRAGREGRKASVAQTSMLIEALNGIRVVKAFNLESRQLKRFREYSRHLIHHGMKGVQAKELANPIIEVVAGLGIGGLLLFLFWTHQSPETLATLLAGVIMLFTPIKKVAGVHILFEQAGPGVERLVDILAEKPTVVECLNPKPLKGFGRDIVFENVNFSYGHDLVVRDFNLRIPRGFKVGLAGESGSGKSTIINLVFRFYDPTKGSIRIDGTDIREISFNDLRQQMALVSQDIFVFRTTVAENIASGKLDATREEIEAAAKAANAHEFILKLPNGYDTLMGERGMTLSGGQRQRLAIARAFVRNAPILVLDEATASLDSKSEAEVQAAINRLEENRTVISVAHRLSTLAAMDHIIVLSQGQVVEQGGFDELVRAKGLFAQMAARQGIFAA